MSDLADRVSMADGLANGSLDKPQAMQYKFELTLENLMLIVLKPPLLNHFSRSLHLHPYFVCASNEGSSEPWSSLLDRE